MSFDLGSLFKMAALAALTMGTGGAAAPLMGAEAAGGAAGAAGGGGWLSSLLGGGMAGAAPGVALPAATSGAGIANASPEFLSAVGLPDLAGSGATAAGSTSMAAPDSMLNQWLKTSVVFPSHEVQPNIDREEMLLPRRREQPCLNKGGFPQT